MERVAEINGSDLHYWIHRDELGEARAAEDGGRPGATEADGSGNAGAIEADDRAAAGIGVDAAAADRADVVAGADAVGRADAVGGADVAVGGDAVGRPEAAGGADTNAATVVAGAADVAGPAEAVGGGLVAGADANAAADARGRVVVSDAAAADVGGRDAVETVLMVHGLRGTHHGLELIADGLDEHRVVVPDLPGFGASGPMSGHRHDVEGYASAMIQLIKLLGDRPVTLLGHSFGSIVAAHVASSAPELVRRLVLVNPISSLALNGPRVVLSGLTSAYYSLGKALPPRMGNSLLSNKWIVLAASRTMTRTKDRQLRRFIDQNHLRHFSRFHSPALLNETFLASVNNTVMEYVDALTMPTLLIAGESDEIAPLPGQRVLAKRLDDAELVVLPDVGHLVHYETPVAAANQIKRFLAAS
ncbi:alpha/beta fold hydrolase [Saccharopolyspora erythraea]|uniref:alpha/beta fold hydrolase n=1 Tax=Saccharopolyspora erythraea TaxID=1836 RepID=UPI000311139B|nr:alpha/beta hydrolase [Saccharopolyspora erythraea]